MTRPKNMEVEELHLSKDQLIEELINRDTFAGVVIFHREDVKDGRMANGEIVLTKSPPLTREGVEHFLHVGQSLVAQMFGPQTKSSFFDSHHLPENPLPLRMDEGGALRVGAGRVTLDLVVEQYENGVTPEDLVRAYGTLQLADVYAVIAFYLRNKPEVQEYLARRQAAACALRERIESDRPRLTRDDLLTRSIAAETANAAVGQ